MKISFVKVIREYTSIDGRSEALMLKTIAGLINPESSHCHLVTTRRFVGTKFDDDSIRKYQAVMLGYLRAELSDLGFSTADIDLAWNKLYPNPDEE